MRGIDIDSLLQQRFPDASFHDSELRSMKVDWAGRRAQLEFYICVGGETYKPGILELDGLLFLATEAPNAPSLEWLGSPLRITADGSFPDVAVETSLKLPGDLPTDAICHYLYAGNTNGFTVFAATNVSFAWSDTTA